MEIYNGISIYKEEIPALFFVRILQILCTESACDGILLKLSQVCLTLMSSIRNYVNPFFLANYSLQPLK